MTDRPHLSANASMAASDVLRALGVLRTNGIDAWVAGGWAVDALVGAQTRDHRDLDLALRSEHVDRAVDALREVGYELELDLRPARLVMGAPTGRSIDLHPVVFDRSGFGRQRGDDGRVFEYPPDGFAIGAIAGNSVPCLSPRLLVQFHLGYEPKPHDRRDMALLRDRLGIALPPPY